MDERVEYYKKIDDEAKLNLENSEKIKEEYLQKLELADQEILAKKEDARKVMEQANAAKVQEAQNEAEKIIASARQIIEIDRAKMLQEAQNEIAGMVVSATEKLAINSSTEETFDLFLDAAKRGEENE